MECGVENSNVRLVLAKDLVGGLDAQDGGGVVQGSQRAQVVDGLDDLGGDEAALLELLAAVDHAVTDGVDLRDAVDDLACTGGHLLHDLGECLGVGGEDGGGGGFLAVGSWVIMLLSMPMRSHRPLQRTFSPSISISWYFRLEEPQLITRIFMEYPP